MIQQPHHQQIRKRIYQNLEPYPHPDKFKRFLDKLIFVVGIIGPLMTIPQIINIWVYKNVAGVALITWCSNFVVAIIWTTYGIAHKEKPIIITYILWIILNGTVVLGILLYR